MDLSGTLDVVIGLLFIFMVFSLVVSGIYESGARLLESRSRLLWRSLRQLLDGDTAGGFDRRPDLGTEAGTELTDKLYAHPIIQSLEEPRKTGDLFTKTRLSHIPPTDFGRALIDVLLPAGTNATSVDAVRAAVNDSEIDDSVKRSILPIASDAAASLDNVREEVGKWFDSRMAFASQIYKRNTRWIMVVLGFAVAAGFNVSVIDAAEELYRDDALRAVVAEQAVSVVEACSPEKDQPVDQDAVSECARAEVDKIDQGLILPIGWTEGRNDIDGWHILGWLVAAIALAQGAPFWFDLLRKTSSVRK